MRNRTAKVSVMSLWLSRFGVAIRGFLRRCMAAAFRPFATRSMLGVTVMRAIKHTGRSVPVVPFATAPDPRRAASQYRSQRLGPLHTPAVITLSPGSN